MTHELATTLSNRIRPLSRRSDVSSADLALAQTAQPHLRLRAMWQDPALRTALGVFIGVRLALGLWLPFVRQVVYNAPLPPDPVARPYKGVAVETNPWLEAWQRWDTLHYQAIAERGYSAFDSALFAPPLYPLLMRLAASAVGGDTLLGGILVSNVAYLAALVALYRLVLEETRDPGTARRSLMYLAFFPSAFFFLAAYSESLFLLAAILCLASARHRRWTSAGLWGAAAALTRIPGLMLVVPLAYLAIAAWFKARDARGLRSVGLSLAGAALFPLYVWIDQGLPPGVILSASISRGSEFALPGYNVLRSIQTFLAGTLGANDVIDLGFTLVFLAMAVPVWRRLPRVYGVYYVSVMALYLTRLGTLQPLYGMTRYVLALFPSFIVLARWGSNPVVNRVVVYLFWPSLLFLSGIFALWGWVG